ncbi:transcriptional regulator [Streptomyces sp. NRRL F-5755]|uniref:Crp/Fnr family transcriptional regulator n=1 Tax=Streptomyces sp. NRRL F-5755 TaxID=1519475 RepID=UPI0006AD9081|nr:Crp/Fnr family transcriptional regulator [Streptomyces sp. NRRL F-5755]KOU07068.1 transcriptional regulator [Streptomyces sp. NRRL F-5755]
MLGRLPERCREDLLHLGTVVHYPAHRTLLRQGDGGRHVLLLTQGVVKVESHSEDGYAMLLAVRVAGDLVGEMAAFEGRPRSGSVIACGDVSARVIQMEALTGYLTQHPDAMVAVLGMLSARLRWANRRRLDFRAYHASVRLARVLVETAQTYGHAPQAAPQRWLLGVTLTQAELASLAALGLATTEKALADLARRGLVERGYREITISDIPRLRAFAKMSSENPY